MQVVRAAVCVVLAIFIGAVVEASAQGQDASQLAGWERSLAELEPQVAALRADDRQSIAAAAARLRELDGQVTQWLQQRGRPVDPIPQGQDLHVRGRRCLEASCAPRAGAQLPSTHRGPIAACSTSDASTSPSPRAPSVRVRPSRRSTRSNSARSTRRP